MNKYTIPLILLSYSFNTAIACTSFGIITNNGTIIAKNRDAAYYAAQSFELTYPLRQFNSWYDNNYNHQYKFYALIAHSDVKMGVNEFGLTAIEEDPLFPNNSDAKRSYNQPIDGYAEGMVLYGVLQNFNSVDEIKPYIKQIFSHAAPNFYQFADSKKILAVEVAYGNNDQDGSRRFTYHIYNKPQEIFTHTNTYLSPQFIELNNIGYDKNKSDGAKARLSKITNLVKSQMQNSDYSKIDRWANLLMDTDSRLGICSYTSIFRSYIHDETYIGAGFTNPNIYGTASNLTVINTGNPQTSIIKLRIIDSITKLNHNNDQLIKYKDLTISLYQLFNSTNKLNFIPGSFTRHISLNNTACS